MRKSHGVDLGRLSHHEYFLGLVDNLALVASSLYSGVVPTEAFPCVLESGEGLPWMNEYWEGHKNRDSIRFPLSEMRRYVYKLHDQSFWVRRNRDFDKFDSGKKLVQALAVESVMFLDRSLVCLMKRKGLQATSWLAGASEAALDAVGVVAQDFPQVWGRHTPVKATAAERRRKQPGKLPASA